MVEELKDLQVAPGTRLAKFQVKVKGEKGRKARSRDITVQSERYQVPGGCRVVPPGRGLCADHSPVAPGYPAPRLYWFKDGQPLTASEHIHMADRKTLHTLEVVSVTCEDDGQYSAYISNAVGAAYSSARLIVRGGCEDWVVAIGRAGGWGALRHNRQACGHQETTRRKMPRGTVGGEV